MSRFLCFVAVALAAVLLSASPAAGDTYTPPVDAAVVDTFRLPHGPYGPGNRGLEYDTDPGQAVKAIGDGLVVFAGPVAGNRAVTVLHPDGLRSSYSYLDEVLVEVGRRVVRGETVGRAGDTFHLGVRSGGTYLDPAELFVRPAVRLVPLDAPDHPTAATPKSREPAPAEVVRRAWAWLTGAVTLAGRS